MPQGKGRTSRGSCLGGLSCFGGSTVAGSDAGHSLAGGRVTATWFTWSRFRKKKKTVPVDASATELLPEKIIVSGNVVQQRPQAGEGKAPAAVEGGYGGKHEEATREQPRQGPGPNKTPQPPPAAVPSQGFFWSLRKSNKDGGRSKAQNVESHRNRDSASLERKHKGKQLPRFPFISPKYAAGRRTPRASPPPAPAPTVSRRLCVSRATTPPAAPGRSSTSTSSSSDSPARPKPPPGPSRLRGARPHKKSEERPPAAAPCPSSVGRNDQVVGLSVLAVVLVVMVPFGRVSAIIFTCAWFYIMRRLRAATTSEAGCGGGGESSAGVDDWDSEEYKKRVVLEGLLQRDGRRASVFA